MKNMYEKAVCRHFYLIFYNTSAGQHLPLRMCVISDMRVYEGVGVIQICWTTLLILTGSC